MGSLLGVLLALSAVAQSQRMAGQFVVSDSLPPIRIEVDPSLGYLGHAAFPVGDAAQAEQFIYADIQEGRLVRAVIVHFEHFLPGNDARFRYPPAPAESLGSHSYLHQHWWIGADFFTPAPVKDLLGRRGLIVDTAYLADRHVRVVDSLGKHELIIFYLESPRLLPAPVGRVEPGMAGNIPRADARALADRARKAFRVLED